MASSLIVNLGEGLHVILEYLRLVFQTRTEVIQKSERSFETRSASESGFERRPRLTNSRIGKPLAYSVSAINFLVSAP